MQTRDELIDELNKTLIANWGMDQGSQRVVVTQLYDRIASRAVQDDRLKLLGPRPKECALCESWDNAFDKNLNHHGFICLHTRRKAGTLKKLFAQCPKVEEET